MKIEQFRCDQCGKVSDGDGIRGWYAVRALVTVFEPVVVQVVQLPCVANVDPWAHACSKACALSLASKEMRDLPRSGTYGGEAE